MFDQRRKGQKMIVSTTDSVPGYNAEGLVFVGHVEGFAGSRDINEAAVVSSQKMVEQAKSLGADAVIGFRYMFVPDRQSCWCLSYGTAVMFKIRTSD